MRRFHSKLYVYFKIDRRQISSELTDSLKSRNVDSQKKLVYGGDLSTITSQKSIGSIIFERLIRKDREDQILQVCTSTKAHITTRKYLQHAVAVAERLRESGIKKGDFIVLVGNNSLNMNTALTGIFFLGAVPVPITYKTSLDEFKILMKYIKPKYFGCDQKYVYPFKRALEQSSGGYEASKIFLLNQKRDKKETAIESFEEFIEGRGMNVESFTPADVDNTKEELALVMKALTDGPIGRGVGITHHNLNSVIARYDSRIEEEFDSRVILMVQKVMWMSGIYSLLLCCCFGSKLIVMDEFDEEEFMKTIEEYKVSSCFLYSSKLWQLYKHTFKRKYDLSSCQYIFAVDGGLPQTLINGMQEKTGLMLRPSYGISEMTGLVLEPPEKKKVGCAGKLVPQVFGKVVLDKSLKNAGPNEKGEICFKGPTVTKGYINDEKSTRQLFDKEGYLISGSYGYYDEEGDFFIIDKIHHVIKYKEFIVSPKELEGVIKSLDSVKDVAVSGIEHPTDGFLPLALVAIQRGHKITPKDIIKHVDANVPDYKRLRGGVIFISKIPRSKDNGQINRNLIKKILSKYKMKTEIVLESSPSQEQSETLKSKQEN